MSDSNQQLQQATPPKAKTFTERFFELEEHAEKTTELFLQFMQTLQEIRMDMAQMRGDIDGLLDSTSAVIKLLDSGKTVNKDAIVETILTDRAAAIEANVKGAVLDNKIVETEEVKNDESMVAYRIKDKVRYAYNKVGNLEPSLKTGLVSKKKGDMVEDVEILGVYEIAPQGDKKESN